MDKVFRIRSQEQWNRMLDGLSKLVVKYETEAQTLVKSSLTNVINDFKNLLDGRGE
jgi:hypothetical protein